MALSPGVYHVDNFDTGGTISTDDSTVCGMLVKTVRGPLAVPVLVRSYKEFETIFGGYTTDSDAAYAVDLFFKNGGEQLYVSRVAHYTDVDAGTTSARKSELVIGSGVAKTDEDTGVTADASPTYNLVSVSPILAGTLVVDALDGAPAFADDGLGALSNGDGAVGTVDYETGAIALDFSGAGTTPTTGNFLIDYTPALLTIRAAGEGSDGDNISILTSVNRLVDADIAADYTAGDTSVEISAPGGLKVGQVLYIEDGGNTLITKVLSFSTSVATGTPVHTVDIFPIDAVNSYTTAGTIKSQEFDLSVFYGVSPTAVESYTQVCLESGATNYVVTALSGSSYVRAIVDVENPDLADLAGQYYPAAVSKTALAGGVDVDSDGPIDAADLIGSPDGGQGLYALDAIDEIEVAAAAPYTSGPADTESATWSSSFIFGAQGFASRFGKRDLVVLVDTQGGASASSALAARTAAGYTGDAAAFSAMYFPRLVVSDPLLGTSRAVTPLGAVMGRNVATDKAVGPFRSAAGTSFGVIEGVLGVEQKINSSTAGSLNAAGINVIRFIRTKGTVIDGVRTLDDTDNATFTYLSTKRSVIQFQRDITAGISDLLFENNDTPLWNKLKNRINNYLNAQWKAGALKGTEPTEAYETLVGEKDGVQTSADTRAGFVQGTVGVALQRPGEFIQIKWRELVQ